MHSFWWIKSNTVNRRYNAVEYDDMIIVNTPLQLLRQNTNLFYFEPTKFITYLSQTGQLRDVFWKDFEDNWPRYKVIALYVWSIRNSSARESYSKNIITSANRRINQHVLQWHMELITTEFLSAPMVQASKQVLV